jgi:hypothetical protein
MKYPILVFFLSLGLNLDANAQEESTAPLEHSHETLGCDAMEVWDYSMAMCMPLAMKDMPMKMAMFSGHGFLIQNFSKKPRGRNAFAAPNMFMLDVGSSVGDSHYINLDIMGTLEKWTFPEQGYPELLQIGEENENHEAFLDAQHPHSSPIMGLTLSDTISLHNNKDHIKIWFAPRGQASEGPVAFMHRKTSTYNPDAPLGHHIGQDVGHISSTVVGTSLRLADTTIEISSFNGTEPEPTKVDLPMATPNSYSARLIQQFNANLYAMSSASFVKEPEVHDPDLDHIWRYSASLYSRIHFESGWVFQNAFIWGLVNFYDHASSLNSFGEEFLLQKHASNIWGRIEAVQRTPEQLQIAVPTDANKGRWVTALTLGYTHKVFSIETADFGLGGSVTQDFLPSEFHDAYGGNPFSARIYLQAQGMKMWNL